MKLESIIIAGDNRGLGSIYLGLKDFVKKIYIHTNTPQAIEKREQFEKRREDEWNAIEILVASFTLFVCTTWQNEQNVDQSLLEFESKLRAYYIDRHNQVDYSVEQLQQK